MYVVISLQVITALTIGPLYYIKYNFTLNAYVDPSINKNACLGHWDW